MFYSKSCPRCRGDIFIDEDVGRCYQKCLQCGYEREIIKESSARKNWSGKNDKVTVSQSTVSS